MTRRPSTRRLHAVLAGTLMSIASLFACSAEPDGIGLTDEPPGADATGEQQGGPDALVSDGSPPDASPPDARVADAASADDAASGDAADFDAPIPTPCTQPGADQSACVCESDVDCGRFDDADLCNGRVRCLERSCAFDPTTVVACDHANDSPCQVNKCNPVTGSCGLQAKPNGTLCSDGSGCTSSDQCWSGACTGTPRSCSTCEGCNPVDGQCVLNPGFCKISGACVTDGQTAPGAPCLACNASANPNAWSPRNVGTSCDPQNRCFVTGACSVQGACAGIPVIPPPVSPSVPTNGARVGDVFASGPAFGRRPLFRWSQASDSCPSSEFEIQLDDSCTPGALDSCAFPSPELSQRTFSKSFRPTVDLPVRTVRPIASRYYWRVRACREDQCSAWSRVQYFDLGAPRDVNGDGYSDLVTSAPFKHRLPNVASYNGALHVYFGGPQGLNASPNQTWEDSDVVDKHYVGESISTGDLNGDGYVDVVTTQLANSQIRLLVFYGSATGLSSTPSVLTRPTIPAWADSSFTTIMDAEGDSDGDGFADLMVAASPGGATPAMLYAFSGGVDGVPAAPSYVVPGRLPAFYGDYDHLLALSAGGDVTGDGVGDVVVARTATSSSNVVLVVLAGSRVAPPVPTWIGTDKIGLKSVYGRKPFTSNADLTGDGISDIVLGGYFDFGNRPADYPVLIFQGGQMPSRVRSLTINPAVDTDFGHALAPIDFDGDGVSDLAIGGPGILPNGVDLPGRLFSYEGVVTAATPATVIPGGIRQFGVAVEEIGDVNGDGFRDLAVSADNAIRIFHGSATGLVSSVTLLNPNPSGSDRFGQVLAR